MDNYKEFLMVQLPAIISYIVNFAFYILVIVFDKRTTKSTNLVKDLFTKKTNSVEARLARLERAVDALVGDVEPVDYKVENRLSKLESVVEKIEKGGENDGKSSEWGSDIWGDR